MKKYMVVYHTPDEHSLFNPDEVIKGMHGAAFFDHVNEAEQFRMDCECGLGGRAQVYEWKTEDEYDTGCYEFMYD